MAVELGAHTRPFGEERRPVGRVVCVVVLVLWQFGQQRGEVVVLIAKRPVGDT